MAHATRYISQRSDFHILQFSLRCCKCGLQVWSSVEWKDENEWGDWIGCGSNIHLLDLRYNPWNCERDWDKHQNSAHPVSPLGFEQTTPRIDVTDWIKRTFWYFVFTMTVLLWCWSEDETGDTLPPAYRAGSSVAIIAFCLQSQSIIHLRILSCKYFLLLIEPVCHTVTDPELQILPPAYRASLTLSHGFSELQLLHSACRASLPHSHGSSVASTAYCLWNQSVTQPQIISCSYCLLLMESVCHTVTEPELGLWPSFVVSLLHSHGSSAAITFLFRVLVRIAQRDLSFWRKTVD
jgi:hypothetical protein